MAEQSTEQNQTEQQTHVRASKVATYFGTGGVLSWGLTALAILLHAPLSVPGLLIIGGGIALASSEGGRNFARKVGDQIVDLGNDFMSHLSEDVNRLSKWWHRVTAPKPKAPEAAKTAPATEAPAPTFKPAANAPEFNTVSKPGVTDDVAPVITAAPEGPKPKL